jgi:hypothetical protein
VINDTISRDIGKNPLHLTKPPLANYANSVKERLSVPQIARIEPFGEPAGDRSEKLARLILLALVAPKPRHAHCDAQFPGFCFLLGSSRRRLAGTIDDGADLPIGSLEA